MKHLQVFIKLVVLSFAFITAAGVVYGAEQVYGWKIMSVKERTQYLQDIQHLSTQWERNRYRQQHHKNMLLRLREYGGSLNNDKSAHQSK